ncbi:MAG TPA: invasion associated locus B family protein [Alphaproteobacteria bacterium]|nr:invasion associated locus B family protein [Alphaproteobacteria bacterium]
MAALFTAGLFAAGLLAVPGIAGAQATKAAAKAPPKRLYAGRHGAWVLQCFNNPQQRVFCNLGQVQVYRLPAKAMKQLRAAKYTGPPRVILLVHATSQSEVVTFVSPTGWAKESRIIARVDKGFGFGIDAPEKRALAPISPDESLKIIEAMKKGNKLRIRFLPAIGDVQQTAFDLRGFSAGVAKMRALVKRHGKDEPGARKLGPRVTKSKSGPKSAPKSGSTKKP